MTLSSSSPVSMDMPRSPATAFAIATLLISCTTTPRGNRRLWFGNDEQAFVIIALEGTRPVAGWISWANEVTNLWEWSHLTSIGEVTSFQSKFGPPGKAILMPLEAVVRIYGDGAFECTISTSNPSSTVFHGILYPSEFRVNCR